MKSYRDYFYPGTETLKNKFGIRDPVALTIVEGELTRDRLRQAVPRYDLTSEGLRAIHRHIFQDIYEWAGEFRTVDMAKVQARGKPPVRFAPGARIARVEIPRLFGELAHDLANGSFDGLDRRTFAYRAAVYMADLNYVHPFPEGNGRTQRILLERLAERAGFALDHACIHRDSWMPAAVDSHGQPLGGKGGFGPHVKMTDVIERALREIL